MATRVTPALGTALRRGPTVPRRTETLSEEDRSVQQARRRFARRQWARRWLAWRRVLVVLLVAGVLAGGVWLVFFSSVMAVKGVRVEGTAVLDPREVRRVAAVPGGAPLATVDLDGVQQRVTELVPVLDVDVSRSWPDRVRIVDDEGVRFRSYPSRPRGLPLLRDDTPSPRDGQAGDDQAGDEQRDAFAEAAAVVTALPADLVRRVDYVSVRTIDTISLSLRDGRTVLWGSAAQSASKAEVLAVLLERKASSYDVSVPGRPVIRP
jgi:cell division protein FtsQ